MLKSTGAEDISSASEGSADYDKQDRNRTGGSTMTAGGTTRTEY